MKQETQKLHRLISEAIDYWKLSQNKLAFDLGISPSAFSNKLNLVNGSKFTVVEIEALTDGLFQMSRELQRVTIEMRYLKPRVDKGSRLKKKIAAIEEKTEKSREKNFKILNSVITNPSYQ